jgi:hypothetical protein
MRSLHRLRGRGRSDDFHSRVTYRNLELRFLILTLLRSASLLGATVVEVESFWPRSLSEAEGKCRNSFSLARTVRMLRRNRSPGHGEAGLLSLNIAYLSFPQQYEGVPFTLQLPFFSFLFLPEVPCWLPHLQLFGRPTRS